MSDYCVLKAHGASSQDVVPDQLLGSAGEHFDDDPMYALRRRITQMHGDHMLLPARACPLLNHVMERGLRSAQC